MSFLQMSLAASVMILVILLIRTLAIHRLPKRFFLLLWVGRYVKNDRLVNPLLFHNRFHTLNRSVGKRRCAARSVFERRHCLSGDFFGKKMSMKIYNQNITLFFLKLLFKS